jgi:uncharacterized peroxidase-related enzyme
MPDMPQDEAFSSVSPRFPLPDINALPDDIKQRIVDVQAKSGFVPNVFLVYARRPAEFRAFFAYHDALMDSDVGLTRAEREMIVVATSGANRCLYCVVAHGAILRTRAKDEQIAEQLAVNYRKANISPRQLAMLDLAMKVSADAANVTEEDFTVLQAHGFDNNAIWDICAITAFFGLSNRMANVTSMQPNMEFYALGRDLGRR